MYFLHAINSDRQTRLLNVLGQIAMILGDKKMYLVRYITIFFADVPSSWFNSRRGKGCHRPLHAAQAAYCFYSSNTELTFPNLTRSMTPFVLAAIPE